MNTKNFKLVLDTIKSDPTCWNQKAWHCGTQHCFAGHAQLLHRGRVGMSTVRQDARIFLGLTLDEANYLFAPDRTIKDFENFLSKGEFDWDGFDQHGRDRQGYDRNGLDREGFDRYGFNRVGYDRHGYNREGRNAEGFDRTGHDAEGFDRRGFDRHGYNREGWDCFGFNREGFDRNGYDADGLDKNLQPRPLDHE